VNHVTCLGCGCACDDITVRVDAGRIVQAERACELGVAWFGDGSAPSRAIAGGADTTVEAALDEAATLLSAAGRVLVLLAPELSCESQRAGVAIADHLGAALDSVTSSTAMASILAAQERGRAGATLGEIRHRADLLVCWGVDPAANYPRFMTRYVPDAGGLHVGARIVFAVDIGAARGPAAADGRVAIDPAEEVDVLTALAAGTPPPSLSEFGRMLLAARYAVVVVDGEPGEAAAEWRTAALVTLVQALNGPTRAALLTLRAGGNRSGADAVMTSQTGYPATVDFAAGYPRYRPHDGGAVARLSRGEMDAVLVLGEIAKIPAHLRALLAQYPSAVIGPHASTQRFAGTHVVVDTGTAGIHDAGTALRMDDVPLPLRRVIDGPPETAATIRALGTRLTKRDAVDASARRIVARRT
jgi:formylmethanofuran dehydrogenase subunit B